MSFESDMKLLLEDVRDQLEMLDAHLRSFEFRLGEFENTLKKQDDGVVRLRQHTVDNARALMRLAHTIAERGTPYLSRPTLQRGGADMEAARPE